jgi:hypothetical protein
MLNSPPAPDPDQICKKPHWRKAKILRIPYDPNGKERKTRATFFRALIMTSLPEIGAEMIIGTPPAKTPHPCSEEISPRLGLVRWIMMK